MVVNFDLLYKLNNYEKIDLRICLNIFYFTIVQ